MISRRLNRANSNHSTRRWLTSLAAVLGTAMVLPAQAGTMMLGTYPDKLFTVDEESGKVLERIQLTEGLPTSLRLSDDGKKIYATTITTAGIVVLDAKTRKILNQFSLNSGISKYRFNGGVPDAAGRYFYTQVVRIDKEIDRYKVSKPMFAVVDLQQKKIVRTAELDAQDDTQGYYRAGFMLSPDGKTMYAFRDKVLVIDTATLKVVDRIDLAKPEGMGLENISFGGGLEMMQTPGKLVALFNAIDPVIKNKQFGIGTFDLSKRTFDFKAIGPVPTAMTGLEVTPDGKTGYTVATIGTLGNKRCEFWRFDMPTTTLTQKVEFPCRSRFNLGMSSNGQKLYIHGASYDIEVYDAATLKLDRVIDMAADATMAGLLLLK